MISERDQQMLTEYYIGEKKVDDIVAEYGYSDRSTLYKKLKKPEYQEFINKLTEESLKDSIRLLRMHTRPLAKELVKIAKGDIKNEKQVFAQLQGINSALEKAGMNSKTIVLEDGKGTKEEDFNQLMDLLQKKKEVADN
ncbi:hypothetical protein [Bacillus infantis]|uniref:hypothetical protein n=1 Tax=Bacillus infantis TaxID=324767 RepID=UPI003CEF3237